jgi:hypothetical protein
LGRGSLTPRSTLFLSEASVDVAICSAEPASLRKSMMLRFCSQEAENRESNWIGHRRLTYSAIRWSAIARGAVLHGLSISNVSENMAFTVSARVARASYGIVYEPKFDETRHTRADKKWCEIHRHYVARNQMKWFLKTVCMITMTTRATWRG